MKAHDCACVSEKKLELANRFVIIQKYFRCISKEKLVMNPLGSS